MWKYLAIGTLVLNFSQAHAFSFNTTFEKSENISGVPVKFRIGLNANFPSNACQPATANITLHLDDLNRQLLNIIKSSGIEKNIKCGDQLSLSGARAYQTGSLLGMKISGTVGRQECIKTKVPEFRGLKVTMKNRIVASNTFRSNASVVANFQPKLNATKDKAWFALVGRPQINVSNDIYRSLLKLFDFDRRIRARLATSINKALGNPAAVLNLPDHLAGLKIHYDSLSIVNVSGQPAINMRVRVDHRQSQFTGYLGHISRLATGVIQAKPLCN